MSRPPGLLVSWRAAPRLAVLASLAAVVVAAAAVGVPPPSGGARVAELSAVAAPGSDPDPGAGVPAVVVSPSGAQTMQGFGASGAWWVNDLIHFPADVRSEVADQLFGPDGIDLSGYRYNIGGGGEGVSVPAHVAQSFLVRPGVYDWSRDPGGVAFLRLAASHHVPVLTGFVNSAPSPWTSNGATCGGTLVPSAAPYYAWYLTDLVRHMKQAFGINLSYVSPMNEPDWSFSSCTQEGTAVPVRERASVVAAVGRALAEGAPWARVIADESSKAFLQFLPHVPEWMSDPTAAGYVAALAHHTYDYPTDAQLAQVATVGARFHVPTWATEICCFDGYGFGPSYDPTMSSGMWLADTIWSDLAVTRDSAFYWWSALSPRLGCAPAPDAGCPAEANPRGWNDGLLYYDRHYAANGDYGIWTTKRFWVMGNFSRYVRPGAVLHPVTGAPPGVRLLAFQHGPRWTVVAIDESAPSGPASGKGPGSPAGAVSARQGGHVRLTDAPETLRVVLPSSAGKVVATGAHRTDASLDLADVARPRRSAPGSFVAELAPESVTTYTFAVSPPASRRSHPAAAPSRTTSHGAHRKATLADGRTRADKD